MRRTTHSEVKATSGQVERFVLAVEECMVLIKQYELETTSHFACIKQPSDRPGRCAGPTRQIEPAASHLQPVVTKVPWPEHVVDSSHCSHHPQEFQRRTSHPQTPLRNLFTDWKDVERQRCRTPVLVCYHHQHAEAQRIWVQLKHHKMQRTVLQLLCLLLCRLVQPGRAAVMVRTGRFGSSPFLRFLIPLPLQTSISTRDQSVCRLKLRLRLASLLWMSIHRLAWQHMQVPTCAFLACAQQAGSWRDPEVPSRVSCIKGNENGNWHAW